MYNSQNHPEFFILLDLHNRSLDASKSHVITCVLFALMMTHWLVQRRFVLGFESLL